MRRSHACLVWARQDYARYIEADRQASRSRTHQDKLPVTRALPDAFPQMSTPSEA